MLETIAHSWPNHIRTPLFVRSTVFLILGPPSAPPTARTRRRIISGPMRLCASGPRSTLAAGRPEHAIDGQRLRRPKQLRPVPHRPYRTIPFCFFLFSWPIHLPTPRIRCLRVVRVKVVLYSHARYMALTDVTTNVGSLIGTDRLLSCSLLEVIARPTSVTSTHMSHPE